MRGAIREVGKSSRGILEDRQEGNYGKNEGEG